MSTTVQSTPTLADNQSPIEQAVIRLELTHPVQIEGIYQAIQQALAMEAEVLTHFSPDEDEPEYIATKDRIDWLRQSQHDLVTGLTEYYRKTRY